MLQRRSIRTASAVATLAAFSAAFALSGGCYRHVVSATGPGSSAYEIQEPADQNTPIVSDLKPQPKSNLTKGGRPVD